MPYQMLIRNGLVIDGTGAPGFRADVAIDNGRVVAIGDVGGASADRVIDASDLIVSPGLVDPHAHFDAQICWDTEISPTSWHGVTTVVSGNCGVGIAPCRPGMREVATRDLVGVEAIPFEALNAGITWDWETFPEYIEAANRRGPAINLGMLAPLTPFRHWVMGEAAHERAANETERGEIARLLQEAVKAGAVGFSTSRFKQHIGYGARPLACRNADTAELSAYAQALGAIGQGTIQIALTQMIGEVSDEELALLEHLLDVGGRPITWSAIIDRDDRPFLFRETLEKTAGVRARGAIPQVAGLPITRDVSMLNPSFLGGCASFQPLLGKGKEELARAFADPGFRDAFRRDLERPVSFSGNWDAMRLTSIPVPELEGLIGKTVGEIARLRGVDGVDALLDLTLSGDFETEFALISFNGNDANTAEIFLNENTLIGLADAGAHVDSVCDARQTTYVLGKWVRERGVLTWEQAIKKLAADPADMFGLHSRGRLKVGNPADVVIFDPTTVDCAPKWETRNDLPAGAKRLVISSVGVEHTIVAGEVVWEDNRVTEARPGRVVNS